MHLHPPPKPGTGCIFHYDENFPEGSGKGFKESDTPNFTGSYYSFTKVRLGAPAPPCGMSCGKCGNACRAACMAACGPHAGRRVLCRCERPPSTQAQRLAASRDGPGASGPPPCRLQAMLESLIKEFPNVLTLRVRMPIVPDLTYPRNFITKVQRVGVLPAPLAARPAPRACRTGAVHGHALRAPGRTQLQSSVCHRLACTWRTPSTHPHTYHPDHQV